MADLKISALTSATTPLAGTEVLPIVQAGATVKVAVSNLTAGRAVAAASVTTTGNIATAVAGQVNTRFVQGLSGTNVGAGAYIDLGNSGLIELATLGADKSIFLTTTGSGSVSTPGNFTPATAAKGINFTANTPAAGMTSQLLNWYEEGTWTPGQGANLTVVGAFSSAGKYTRIGRQVTVFGSLTGATSVAITGGVSEMFTGLPFAPADGTSFVITNSNYSAGGFGRTAGTAGYCITTFAAIGTLYFTITYQMA